MDDVTVYFTYDTVHFSLNYPRALVNMSIVNLKKLFRYMLTGNRNANENAVIITEDALEHIVAATKAAWHETSVCYQDKYVENERRLRAVRSAKSRYDRSIKLQAYFKEIKTKYYD